jgi:hypothetical protein|tara:strand:+ start:1082 stop:1264 length:183 start_codon:yes stop_codon:yes gene_type:complete
MCKLPGVVARAKANGVSKQLQQEEGPAREASGGFGYPFAMQDDLIERGEWDETGKSYRTS